MMLLNNNNKKFIKTLSGNCLKANRTRNGIALLAIILTTLLFTAVTTVFQGAQSSMKEQQIRMSGTKFMVSIKYMTPKKAEEILKDKAFTKVGVERAISMAENEELKRINASVTWMDNVYAEGCYSKPQKGHMPEKINEIACDSVVLKLLGLPYETGSRFTLEYEVNGEPREKEMTVCGTWKGVETEQNTSMLVSKAFIKENVDESTLTDDAAVAGSYTIRGSFADEEDISGQLDKLIERAGYHPKAERGEEGFIIHHTSPAYETDTKMDTGTVLAIAAAILLILLAGYLIIYNIFRISVIKDIRLYGQLKTIGASPKQIQYMVLRQGLSLSWIGIPAGLVLGWLLGNILLPMALKSSAYSETTFIWPDIFVWIASAVFALFTVWVSVSRPGKIAGRISPVEAIRYQEQDGGKKKQRKGKSSKHRILRMAYANMGRNKGKTILVVLSISLSVILLNSVLNIVGCFDKEKYVERNIVSDFNVMNTQMGRRTGDDAEKILPSELADSLEQMEGVKDFGKTYCYEIPAEEDKDGYGGVVKIQSWNGKAMPQEYEGTWDPRRMVLGMDKNAFDRVNLIEGVLDYEKLATGKYIVMAGYLDDNGEYSKDMQEFHAGDQIETVINEEVKTYEVLAVIGMNHSMLPDYSSGGYEMIGMSENVFLEEFPGVKGPIHCLFDAEKGKFDSLNAFLESRQNNWNIKINTRLSAEAEFDEMMVTYSGVGVILSAVFAIIGILNLLNVILTGAFARQGEFATMRSIGMTGKQLRKLFLYEGIFYAVLAGAAGIIISSILSVTMVKGILGGFWFAKYQFIITPAVLAALICIVIAGGISYVIDRIWNQGSIVEKMRKAE